MGDVVNLRRARKARDRAAASEQAVENRVRFGRTKAERDRIAAQEALEASRLDGHRLATDTPGTGPKGTDGPGA
jgi:hypothetical protein